MNAINLGEIQPIKQITGLRKGVVDKLHREKARSDAAAVEAQEALALTERTMTEAGLAYTSAIEAGDEPGARAAAMRRADLGVSLDIARVKLAQAKRAASAAQDAYLRERLRMGAEILEWRRVRSRADPLVKRLAAARHELSAVVGELLSLAGELEHESNAVGALKTHLGEPGSAGRVGLEHIRAVALDATSRAQGSDLASHALELWLRTIPHDSTRAAEIMRLFGHGLPSQNPEGEAMATLYLAEGPGAV